MIKYLILIFMLVTTTTIQAEWRDSGQYDTYKERVAEKRASEHPKGSGIGTNRYNIRYDRDYNVDGYKRQDHNNKSYFKD